MQKSVDTYVYDSQKVIAYITPCKDRFIIVMRKTNTNTNTNTQTQNVSSNNYYQQLLLSKSDNLKSDISIQLLQ